MAARGRTQYAEYESDDDESYYEEVGWPQARPPRAASRKREEWVRFPAHSPAPSIKKKVYHQHHSYTTKRPPAEHENIVIENHLNVPQVPRPRASSQGAQPQPNFLVVQQPASHRSHSKQRYREYDYSSSSSSDGRSSHRRRHRHKDSGMDSEIAIQIAKLQLMEAQNQKGQTDPALAAKIAQLEYELERERREDKRKSRYDQDTAAELARLHEFEKRKAQEAEEAAIRSRIEENARKEKLKREAYMHEYEEKIRKEEEAEAAAVAAAEAKRLKRDAERKAEQERLLAQQREKEAKEKAEMQRIIAAQKEKEANERAELQRILAAQKEKERIEKEERDEQRKKILYEEEQRKRKEKEEHEQLRRQILAEEEEKKAKEKKKKDEEEDEFQLKVKERFMKAGYSADYIEDILAAKKRERIHRSPSHRTSNSLAIDISRPTYIRVKVEHLYPETLDHYQLPWEYDPNDRGYIFIKEYISHDLQQSLFEHTRQLRIRKEKLLITDGYTKDTVTTLKPRNVFKDKSTDEMYVVRKKSVSRSPARRSWMFT